LLASSKIPDHPDEMSLSSEMFQDVMNAIRGKTSIDPVDKADTFSLLSYSTLSDGDRPAIGDLQKYLEEQFDVDVSLVGGGYFCSKLTFKITGTAEHVQKTLALILQNLAFREKASCAGFDLVIIDDPYTRLNLRTGELQTLGSSIVYQDNSTTIGDVRGGQVAVHSESTRQDSSMELDTPGEAVRRLISNLPTVSEIGGKYLSSLPAKHENREIITAKAEKLIAEMVNYCNSEAILGLSTRDFAMAINPVIELAPGLEEVLAKLNESLAQLRAIYLRGQYPSKQLLKP
jgi:hypothetical protein